ncbi:MAG: MBL fold metallo-hydrolase [Anaerolineae bacterium]|nr:MBL fold metallo-hydrolase [Anaerolineae bacterium]
MQRLSENLYCFEDTCNVYVIRSGERAVLVDFGSGDVLSHLAALGITRVTDVLLTHHHRDQGQGLSRAAEAGARIWVPHTEQDLFHAVDAHWQAREIMNNYNGRQDRFSLLEPVPVAGTLLDYEERSFGDHRFTVVPTPGHTTGSITLLAGIDGRRCAFSGDLIAAPGQVWTLSATQWSYNGVEGVAASIASLLDLKDRQPDLLLPSHGAPIDAPGPAIDLLVARLWELLQLRGQNQRLFALREQPYEAITPHLLRHRACMANTYVLLSSSRKALLIDFGYDFITGIPLGSDRASRRPWLYTLPALKRQFDVDRVDVALPTHFHDDHVAGLNLLRRVEGAQVWAAESFADILENPARYDLPCLWYDPIPVDRRLPLETPIQWEEYTLTLYPLPGHTRYAVAIGFEVDGRRVLATGDQYQGDTGLEVNYVYGNRFAASDYVASAALYRRLQPDLILSGHWSPQWVTPDYLARIETIGAELERLHHTLQVADPAIGEAGFIARLTPYQAEAAGGTPLEFQVALRNPFSTDARAEVRVVMPEGWRASGGEGESPPVLAFDLAPGATLTTRFEVIPPACFSQRRARIAVDITVNGRRFGQQAEALISAPRSRTAEENA